MPRSRLSVPIEQEPYRQDAAKMYLDGKPMHQVALFYHVHARRVSALFKEMGVPRKGRGCPVEDIRYRRIVARMYRNGKTIQQIARHYHVHLNRVSAILKEMDVPFNKTGRKRQFDWEKAKRRYEIDGWSLDQIAAENSLKSGGSVWEALQKLGVVFRRSGVNYKKRHSPHLPVIRSMLARGYSQQEILKYTGQSIATLRNAEMALGAPSRNSPHYAAWVERLAREAA